jgi:peptide/nickel transport system permease protein
VRYLWRRVGHALVVLLGASLLSFVMAEAAPGDFVDELRLDPRISAETVAALRERYALDASLPEKYLRWLRSVGRGELGFSMAYDAAVGPLLWPRARNTLLLTVPATVLAWLIAVPIGAWAASRQGGRLDRIVAGSTTTLLSVPEVVVGLALLVFALRTGVFPTGGMVSPGFAELDSAGRILDVVAHFALPVTALTLAIAPVVVRHVRASLIDVLHASFIYAARAQGIPERRVLFRHALRAAANPLVSLLGLSIAGLLSASLVVETILSWPGLGPLMIEAVEARDLHLVVGVVTCSTALLVAGTLLADALLYMADPRVRAER